MTHNCVVMCRFFFLLMHYNHPLPLSFLAVVQFAAKRSQPVMNMVAALCDVLESDRNKSKMREYRRQTPIKDSMTRGKEKLSLKTLREGFIRVVHILNGSKNIINNKFGAKIRGGSFTMKRPSILRKRIVSDATEGCA